MERKLLLIAWTVVCIVCAQWARPDALFVDVKDYEGRFKRLTTQYRWISRNLYELTYEAGRRHNVAPEVICAFIHVESRGNPRALSYAGARGLMQIMPFWHKGPAEDLYHPATNIMLGTKILRYYIDRADGNLILAAKYYNAGNRDYFNGSYIFLIMRNVALSCPEKTISEFMLEL